MTKILITGASGQLGSVLTEKLKEKYGVNNVIASDLRINSSSNVFFEVLDATDFDALKEIVLKFGMGEEKIPKVYSSVMKLIAKSVYSDAVFISEEDEKALKEEEELNENFNFYPDKYL